MKTLLKGNRMKKINANIDPLGNKVVEFTEANINPNIKPKNTPVTLQEPITTGMMLALGFFLMGLLLSFLGWVLIGLIAGGCANLISRMAYQM